MRNNTAGNPATSSSRNTENQTGKQPNIIGSLPYYPNSISQNSISSCMHCERESIQNPNTVAAQFGATSSMATNRFPLFCREGSGQFVLYLTQCVFNKPARPPVSEPRVSLKRRQCVYGGMCFVLGPSALQCNIQHLHHGTTMCTRVYETAVNVCYRQTLMWQWCGETHWRRETGP